MNDTIRAGAGPQVGRDLPRTESRAKVTGTAEYIHHLRLPRMLHARIVRSTVAHGRLVAIDTAAARAVPGVHAVYTGEDIRARIPEPYYGPAFHDQPILALGKVRFVGEPVAVVLAADPHVAAEAAALVMPQIEELPAVFDEVEAATATTFVHDALRPAGTFPDLKHLAGRRDTNVALDFRLRRGDPDGAFAKAARVFEHTFRTQPVMHVPLEPMVSVAETDGESVTIHSATQSPSFVRLEIARLLGWPENRVRVRTAFLGGGFGAKLYIKLEALAVACALLARRPVRVALSMEEQFYTITKHASTFRIASAVDGEGRVLARRCEVWWNGGAYADIGPRVTQKSGFTAPGPYDIENVAIDSYAVYTNLPPAGALRGFGIPQLVWAYESHTDMIARALGIDPLAMRRKNLLVNGRPQATGTIVRDAAIDTVLERTAARLGWDGPFDRGAGTVRRGRGLAIGFKASVTPTTSVAMVTLAGDGSCIVHASTVDMGQGSDTILAQMAAEVLGLDAAAVKVLHPDTDATPYDMATLGSRSTYHMGHAVVRAAESVRQQLAAIAASAGLPEATPAATLMKKRFGMQAGNLVGVGDFAAPYAPPDGATGQSPDITPYWMIGATGTEVEVDTETGAVKVLRLVNVADLGAPVNPAIVATQLSGAAVMQLGFTLTEHMRFDEAGQLRNASLAEYRIPGLSDVPPMENEIVESRETRGPFGAKGVGESATFGVSPAIANAIEDAVGVRIDSLPITAEAVLRALRKKAGRPLPEDSR